MKNFPQDTSPFPLLLLSHDLLLQNKRSSIPPPSWLSRLGGSHVPRQQNVLLEAADADDEFVGDLVQFHLILAAKGSSA